MGDEQDPYAKLRPEKPTPDEYVCHCAAPGPIVLRELFSENPLYCARCSREIPPESIGFDEDLANEIAWWHKNQMFNCMLLASDEFSSGAARRLADAGAPFNESGRELVARLNQYRRAYYWMYSFDEAETASDSLSICPSCGNALTRYEATELFVCEPCSIVM